MNDRCLELSSQTNNPPRALLPPQMTQISLAYLVLVSIIT